MTAELDAAVIVEALASLWPAAFTTDKRERRPLKVGIGKDIEAASAGALSKQEISRGLAWYVNGGSYLWRLKAGAERIDLQGQPAGTVTDEEAKHALARLKARKAKHGRQKDASANGPPTAAPNDSSRELSTTTGRRAEVR